MKKALIVARRLLALDLKGAHEVATCKCDCWSRRP